MSVQCTVRIDPDRIFRDLFPEKSQELGLKPYTSGTLPDQLRVAFELDLLFILEGIYGIVRRVVSNEVANYSISDFEFDAAFVGPFAKNYQTFGINVFAIEDKEWFDSGSQNSPDFAIRMTKKDRIARSITSACIVKIGKDYVHDWSVATWLHSSEGSFFRIIP